MALTSPPDWLPDPEEGVGTTPEESGFLQGISFNDMISASMIQSG
jgi:hypothetical protein